MFNNIKYNDHFFFMILNRRALYGSCGSFVVDAKFTCELRSNSHDFRPY